MNELKIKRQFIQTSKAWWANTSLDGTYVDEVSIQLNNTKEGGCITEFYIKWYLLNDQLVPKLEVYDENWKSLLVDFKDILELMGEIGGVTITPDEFVQELEILGIENITPFENPRVKKEEPMEEETCKSFILTMKVNDYNQHGQYYIKAWTFEPSDADIEDAIKRESTNDDSVIPGDYVINFEKIRNENGRVGNEPVWFYLRELKTPHK